MKTPANTQSVLDALSQRGDAREERNWFQGKPNYVDEYALTEEHIEPLILLATKWIDEPEDHPAVFGPVYAWRALGQLRAIDAIGPLLDIQDELDDRGDDWYLEEFPNVFALIGPQAIDQLAGYLADGSKGEFPRAAAANGLTGISKRFPDTRSEVVAILASQLTRREELYNLNGLVVGDLLDLEAVEAAETIEHAYAAGVVSSSVCGEWGRVRQELGVPGLGIAPDQTSTPTDWRYQPGWGEHTQPHFVDPVKLVERQRQRDKAAARKAKAIKKKKKKDRKRNRPR
ncbi:MAG: hypothetical protein MI757_10110 [Pirellulales bacterium]|nr:hypothetical protein [Pirellulales bacterium]